MKEEEKVQVYFPGLPPGHLCLTHQKPTKEGNYCCKMKSVDIDFIVEVWKNQDDRLLVCIEDETMLLDDVTDVYLWSIVPIPSGVEVPRTVLFLKPIEHKGMKLYRFEDNPREEIFAQEWEKEAPNLLDYILSSSNRKDGIETQRDATVAATMIQWLGTPVGWNFLSETVKKCGYELKKREG